MSVPLFDQCGAVDLVGQTVFVPNLHVNDYLIVDVRTPQRIVPPNLRLSFSGMNIK
jgi:hypothetical protein